MPDGGICCCMAQHLICLLKYVTMKQHLIAACLLLTSTIAIGQNRSIESLKGVWQVVSENHESAGLEVVDSTRIYLVYADDKKAITSYKADFTKTPAWFDFTVKDSTQEVHFKSLLQFVNDDLVQWQVFEGEIRPVLFASDRGDLLYLKRRR